MIVERTVIEHYRHGALEDTLLKALAAAGKDNLTPDELAPADEFHIAGRQVMKDFAAEFKPTADTHLIERSTVAPVEMICRRIEVNAHAR